MLLVMKTGVGVRATPMGNDGTGEMAEALKEEMECCGCDGAATDVLAPGKSVISRGCRNKITRNRG